MSAQLARLPDLRDRGSFKDDASDSGYGGSVIDGASLVVGSEDVLNASRLKESARRHEGASLQEEHYRENCRLLTGSIEDTKHILKVKLLVALAYE
jgi:hypothetical protein